MADTAALLTKLDVPTPGRNAAGEPGVNSAKNQGGSGFAEVFDQHVRETSRPSEPVKTKPAAAASDGKNLPANGKAPPGVDTQQQAVQKCDDQANQTNQAKQSSGQDTALSADPDPAADESSDIETLLSATLPDVLAPTDVELDESVIAMEVADPDLPQALLDTGMPVSLPATPAISATLPEQAFPDLVAWPPSETGVADSAKAMAMQRLMTAIESVNAQPSRPMAGDVMARSAQSSADDAASAARGNYLATLLAGGSMMETSGEQGGDPTNRRQGQSGADGLLSTLLMNRFAHDAFANAEPASAPAPATASDLTGDDAQNFNTLLSGARQMASVPGSTVPVIPVNTPMQHHSAWAGVAGERVMWMAQNGIQEAQIQLHPKHLGAMEVRVSYHNDQVNLSFTFQNAAAREAFDAAMPRLREMLNEQGMNLGDVNVAHDSQYGQERKSYQSQSAFGSQSNGLETDDLMIEPEHLARPIAQGLVDMYA